MVLVVLVFNTLNITSGKRTVNGCHYTRGQACHVLTCRATASLPDSSLLGVLASLPVEHRGENREVKQVGRGTRRRVTFRISSHIGRTLTLLKTKNNVWENTNGQLTIQRESINQPLKPSLNGTLTPSPCGVLVNTPHSTHPSSPPAPLGRGAGVPLVCTHSTPCRAGS